MLERRCASKICPGSWRYTADNGTHNRWEQCQDSRGPGIRDHHENAATSKHVISETTFCPRRTSADVELQICGHP